jgi:uncharacterized PurR-regulated membrane protein YhhQ (DUF165 family)
VVARVLPSVLVLEALKLSSDGANASLPYKFMFPVSIALCSSALFALSLLLDVFLFHFSLDLDAGRSGLCTGTNF